MTIAQPAPEPTTRTERAIELYSTRGHLIRAVAANTYEVPSQRMEGKRYEVHYGTSALESCSCPDHEYRGSTCVHMLAVGIHYAKRRGATLRTLARLEDQLQHELLGDEERQELRDCILRHRRRLAR